jgi:Zinc-binding dehydrogenase
VIATISGDAKARLAKAAGARHVVNYKDADAAEQIRRVAPDGVDLMVEVAAGTNAELDQAVLRPRGTISIYANDGGAPFSLDVRRNMGLNARYQFVLLYTVGWDRIAAAAADINQAIEDGALKLANKPGYRFTASPSKTPQPHTAPRDRSVREGAHRDRREMTIALWSAACSGTLLLPAWLRVCGQRITRPLQWTKGSCHGAHDRVAGLSRIRRIPALRGCASAGRPREACADRFSTRSQSTREQHSRSDDSRGLHRPARAGSGIGGLGYRLGSAGRSTAG